jgi:hypothetical protein
LRDVKSDRNIETGTPELSSIMPDCLKCKSSNVTTGHLSITGESARKPTTFIPGTLKWYQFSLDGGAELQAEAFACTDCGLVWTAAAYPEVLREVVKRFSKEP